MKLRAMMMILPVAWCVAATAQEKVFRSNEVTESALIDALTPKQSAAPRTRGLKVESVTDKPVVSKPAKASLLITFETNSAELTPQARQVLDKVGRALTDSSLAEFRFNIEGHADPRGGHEFNERLSLARADSARKYLMEKYQIGEARLNAIGKGDSELINTQDPTAPENRRVTIVTLQN